jgi:hypothetical protein
MITYLESFCERRFIIEISIDKLNTALVKCLGVCAVDISSDTPHLISSILEKRFDDAAALTSCCSNDDCDWLRHCESY